MEMTPQDAVRSLETYVIDADPFAGDRIPKGLPVPLVAKFITLRINAATPLPSLVRMERVVSFYDLQEVCDYLFDLLPARPDRAYVAQAAVVARTIAASCGPGEVQKVSAYYDLLVTMANNTSDVAELVEFQDRLGPAKDPGALGTRIDLLRAGLQPRSEATLPYASQLEEARLGEMRSRLARVDGAQRAKQAVLGSADRGRRIDEEIKMYLSLEYGYLEYLTPWSAARLRRETWASQPNEQIARSSDPALRAEVASRLATLGRNADAFPTEPPENRISLRIRCLRAAEFFGAVLMGEDLLLIRDNAHGQVDLLANE